MSNWSVKYRAKNIDDFVGNDAVIQTLKGYIKNKSIPQAILLSGSTGCGKTSIARWLAQAIQNESIDFVPVKDDKIHGLIEKNMGDERKIDDVRDMISMTQTKSLSSRYKVFLLDEVHMMPKAAASALLKPLEDTPDHVFWILCTDQPGALLPTIRNRCQHLQLMPPSNEDIYKLLLRVCKREKVTLSKKEERNKAIVKAICKTIGDACMGQPRDAIQLLQQCVAFLKGSDEKLDKETVVKLIKQNTQRLKISNPVSLPTDLLTAIYKEDLAALVKRAAEAEDMSQVMGYMIYTNNMWLQECCGVKLPFQYFYDQFKKTKPDSNVSKAAVVASALNDIHAKIIMQNSSNIQPLVIAELVKLVLRLKQQSGNK